jgi:hypothetical protein
VSKAPLDIKPAGGAEDGSDSGHIESLFGEDTESVVEGQRARLCWLFDRAGASRRLEVPKSAGGYTMMCSPSGRTGPRRSLSLTRPPEMSSQARVHL